MPSNDKNDISPVFSCAEFYTSERAVEYLENKIKNEIRLVGSDQNMKLFLLRESTSLPGAITLTSVEYVRSGLASMFGSFDSSHSRYAYDGKAWCGIAGHHLDSALATMKSGQYVFQGSANLKNNSAAMVALDNLLRSRGFTHSQMVMPENATQSAKSFSGYVVAL